MRVDALTAQTGGRSQRVALRAVAAAILGVAGLPAQAQQVPVFETETTLMEVEVRVTDGRGRAAAGLTREDFELLERGLPQRIATFEFVTRPDPQRRPDPQSPTEAQAAGGAPPAQSPADAASDLRRSTFIYIATRGRRQDRQRMHDAVKQFIDENLAPGVFVSIEGSPFTSKAGELDERLREMLQVGPQSGPGGFVDTAAVDLARDFEYSAGMQDLMDELNAEFGSQFEDIDDRTALYRRLRMYEYIDLIKMLGIYPGRKIVVLFATGLPIDEDNFDTMKILEDEATRARVRFFVSDVSGLSVSPPGGDAETTGDADSLFGDPLRNGFATQAQGRQDNQDGLVELARRTGGRAVLNSNDFGEVFDVMLERTGDYYLLGYYPEETEQRGRFRRLRIRVKPPGLRVSHQPGYYEERPFRLMSRQERDLRMHQALTFDTPYLDLPLRVDHEFFRDSQGEPTLVYSVGLHMGDIPTESTKRGEHLELTVIAQASPAGEDGGPPVLDTSRHFEMTLWEDKHEKLRNDPHSWLYYASQMRLPSGEYDWKVIVRDDLSGYLGSYKTRVRIPEARSDLGASSLLLTDRIDDVSGDPQGRAKGKERVPEDVLEVDGTRFRPTAVKTFQKGASIYLLYDIYNAADLEAPPAPMLALYRGRERVAQLPVSSHQTVAEPEARRIRHLAALNSAELAEGDYTIAAMLATAGQERPVIFRKFRIAADGAEE